MRLEWRPRALADIQALRGRVAREQPAAAARVAGRILAAAERLPTYPELGRVGRAPDTRELAVARTPYLQRGIPLSEVQQQLGHARIDSTTIYTKLANPERRQMADRVTW